MRTDNKFHTYKYFYNNLICSLSEKELVNSIKDLSETFITRKGIENYSFDKKLVSAYTMFFSYSNIFKLTFLLENLNENLRNDILKNSIIDFGMGPGTNYFSLLYFENLFKGRYLGVEKSEEMILQAKNLLKDLTLDNYEFSKTLPEKMSHTIIFGNSFNEVQDQELKKIMDSNNVNNIIFMEPGTKEVFQKVMQVRNLLRSSGFKVSYPCMLDGDCPIIEEKKDDWCHQIVRIKHEEEFLKLSEKVSIDREKMPFIGQVFTRLTSNENKDDSRLLRVVSETKHSFLLEVCSKIDSLNSINRIEVPKKKLAKKEIKKMRKTDTGIMVNFSVDKVFENFIRVKTFNLKNDEH